MILLGCTGMAFRRVLCVREEIRTMEELKCLLEMIGEEIGYGRFSLPECFCRAGAQKATPLGEAFVTLGEMTMRASGMHLRDAMEETLGDRLRSVLPPLEYQSFLELVAPRGYAGEAMQRSAVERSRSKIDELLARRKKEMLEKCRVTWCLGMTGGILVILILW